MKRFLSCLLSATIVLSGTPWPVRAQESTQAAAPSPALAGLVQQPYLALFEKAPSLNVSARAIKDFRKTLEREKKQERKALQNKRKAVDKEIKQTQKQLKQLDKEAVTAADREKHRHELHCRIEELRDQLQQTKLALEQGLKITYDNKLAKLKLLEEWPGQHARLQEIRGTPAATDRKFGNFRDIGFRDGAFSHQQNDVKRGQDALEEMKHQGILPPEIEDEAVVSYVSRLAERIARQSDSQVPLRVFVLRSKEINAFALPGGLLFVNSGLLLKADKEAELAGVIAHEIAHSAARHGYRLMKRATIANAIFQAAQIAAVVFTGGVASIGTYYALQYGFYGLGLVLSLQLLGVSRDYEIEADILGTQYLWKAGYNTRGFISFFDRMAQEKGHIIGLSWFRTHPPLYERMEASFKEFILLPAQKEAVDDSSDFRAAKARLSKIVEEMEAKDRDAPTLKRAHECPEREKKS